jgi:hypothetical protein
MTSCMHCAPDGHRFTCTCPDKTGPSHPTKEWNINPGDKVKWFSGTANLIPYEGTLVVKFFDGSVECAVVRQELVLYNNPPILYVKKMTELTAIKPCQAVLYMGNLVLPCTRKTMTTAPHGIHEAWRAGAQIRWGVDERGLPPSST